jgi:hypothetical protein
MGIACNLGRGDGQIAHNSGIRLGAESGEIKCPECGQQVPVKPSHWVGNNGWWNIEAHNQPVRTPYVLPELSEQAKEVIAKLQTLSFEEKEAVMITMGWNDYDTYGYD